MTSFQPGEQQSFTPPQDPWSGTQGVASPPTDPIPAPPRGQFRPGVATPSAPPPSVWSQETVAHDDPYAPQRGGSGGGRAGLYILVTLIVLALGGAGGYGAWYAITQRIATSPNTPTTSPSATVTVSGMVMSEARADQIRVGDCLVNRGTEAAPDMWFAPCEAAGAYRVLTVLQGESIPENDSGGFDRSTANSVCGGVEGWDGPFFGWNSRNNDTLDYFFCMQNVHIG